MRLIWDILDIQPTNDISIIKKAYAQKLKIYHPEDDSVGYQKLREAYDQAVKMSRQSIYKSIPDLVVDKNDNFTFEIIEPLETFKHLEFIDPEPYKQLPTFMELVQALYEDFPSRIHTDHWFELLNNNVLWDLHQFNGISHDLLVYLNVHYFLPRPIWQLLEATFRWKLQAKEDDQFRYAFPKVFANLVEERNVSNFGLTSLLLAGAIDHDAFLRHRELAYKSLLDNNMKAALYSIVEGTTLFPDDPDMLLLKAEYYRRIGDNELLLLTCNDRIRVSPDNPECYYYRARIWLNNGFIPEAVIDLNQALLLDPTEIRAMALLGQCHVKLGELNRARNIYNNILGTKVNDIEAILSLAEIDPPAAEPSSLQNHSQAKSQSSIQPYLQRLNRRLIPLLKFTWPFIASILAMHFIIIISFSINNSETSFSYRLSHLGDTQIIAPTKILSMMDLEAANSTENSVSMELGSFTFSQVYELQGLDTFFRKIVWYDTVNNIMDNNLSNHVVANIFIGYLDGQPIIVRSHESEFFVHEEEPIEVDGWIVHPIAPELTQLIEQMSSDPNTNRIYDQAAEVTYMLDSTVKNKIKEITLNFTDYLIILLGFLYILLISRLIWIWKSRAIY